MSVLKQREILDFLHDVYWTMQYDPICIYNKPCESVTV